MSREKLRKQALGLTIGIVILLLVCMEGALWQEYAFSPQLLASEKLYLLYERNPLLGDREHFYVRWMLNGVWSEESLLRLNYAPVVSVGDRKIAFLRPSGVSIYREELLERAEDTWLFSLELPDDFYPMDGCIVNGKLQVVGWQQMEDGFSLLRVEFEVKRGSESHQSTILRGERKPFPVEVVSFGGRPLLVCLSDGGDIFLLDTDAKRIETPLKTETSFCAESDGRRIHIFTVSEKDGAPSVLNHYITSDIKEFRLARGDENPFSFLFFGRRTIRNINTTLWKGSPSVVCFMGSLIAVWRNGSFQKVLSVSVTSRVFLMIWMGLLLLVALLLVYTAFSMFRTATTTANKTLDYASETATISQRIVAFLLDMLILRLPLLPFVRLKDFIQQVATQFPLLGNPLLLLLILILYFTLFEWLLSATPGKLILGIRVVSSDGKRLTILQAFLRNLFKLADIILIIELIVASLNAKRRRIGDMTADTLVVGGRVDGQSKGSNTRGDVV